MFPESIHEEDTMQSLFMKISHLYAKRSFQQLADTGVHPGQIPMVKLLGEEGGLSQREISQRLHIRPPTVTVSLQRMENAGLIERSLDKKDQRVSRIYLTQKGKDLNKKMADIMKRNEESLFQGFTESEICLMKRFFRQIIRNLENTAESRASGEKTRRPYKQEL